MMAYRMKRKEKKITMCAFNVKELPAFEFQQFFVRIERSSGSMYCLVLLDRNGLTSFLSEATTQEEFDKDCRTFLSSNKYKQAINSIGRGVS